MSEEATVDLCVIGAGSGGLSVAAGAAQMGARVALIEEDKMGGDCLNYGCVPSKSLIAAARQAKYMRQIDSFGIKSITPQVDYAKVHEHIHDVIATIAPNDSAERFRNLGVRVVTGTAKFVEQDIIAVGETRIRGKRFVIATGSSPIVPDIPGLTDIPYLTNETIFDLKEQPKKLIVIGGGPIGCELAQAYSLLGIPVVVLESKKILPKDDAELVDVVRQHLTHNGLELFEGTHIVNVSNNKKGIVVQIEHNGEDQTITGSHVLIATGRKPNLAPLHLEIADVKYTDRGITVDSRLRSSNKRIFAVGDVAGSFQFTHVANYHAGIVLRNALFHLPAKVNYAALPWVTYTTPELAHVGLHESMAQEQGINYQVLRFSYADLDRGQIERETAGLIKIIVTPRGKILGASIVGNEAGELIAPWVLAMHKKLSVKALASMIMPYPTRNEINKRAAFEFYTPKLFSERMRKIVRFLARF